MLYHMSAITPVSVVSVEEDSALRARFIQLLPHKWDTHVDITAFDNTEYYEVEDNIIFVFNGEKPTNLDHVKIAAHAAFTVEVRGIIPYVEDRDDWIGDRSRAIKVSSRYVVAEYTAFEYAWKQALSMLVP